MIRSFGASMSYSSHTSTHRPLAHISTTATSSIPSINPSLYRKPSANSSSKIGVHIRLTNGRAFTWSVTISSTGTTPRTGRRSPSK